MADHHRKGPDGEPVPRDMPDQLAGEGEDPWDAAPDQTGEDEKDAEVPDTDEAGTGREGAPHAANAPSEDPVPDEPTG
ncbi:hypothetical protein [Streptomyces sp. RG80]|uniref:hypothetical protein n=1 Tax=Streptomyces sp. RG80 TaxID=3157340 RepID=UPI00339002D5